VLLMTPALLSADLAQAHADDLRRAARRPRLACGPDGCDGFFSSLLGRLRSDVQRLQLGPTGVAPCPC
jgi:hypothetical protein